MSAELCNTQTTALRRLVDFYLHTAYAGDRLLDPQRDLIDLASPAPGCRPEPLPDRAAALAWFAAEHANLLAIQQLAATQGWCAPAWQLAWALDTFHYRQGYLRNRVECWQAGLAAANELVDFGLRALAHRQLGYACARAGRYTEAVDHLERARTVAERTGDTLNQICVHDGLAWIWAQRNDHQQALAHGGQLLRLAQRLGNPKWEAYGLNSVGWYHARLGCYDQARDACQRALDLARKQRDHECLGYVLDSLGYIAQHTGQTTQALGYYHQALTVYRNLGDSYNEADTVDRVGDVHTAHGQHIAARNAWQQARDLYRRQHRLAEAARVEDKSTRSVRDERVQLDSGARRQARITG